MCDWQHSYGINGLILPQLLQPLLEVGLEHKILKCEPFVMQEVIVNTGPIIISHDLLLHASACHQFCNVKLVKGSVHVV